MRIENIRFISKIKKDLKTMETARITKTKTSKIQIIDTTTTNNSINKDQINSSDFN
jgi:hypothetical protein